MNQKVLYRKLVDNGQPKSLANKMRRKRFGLFQSLVETLTVVKPLKILDAGGTQSFWSTMGMTKEDVQIVLLNLTEDQVMYQNFQSIVGDVRDMSQFKDHEFDVVFSNSVIEHVGNFSDQLRMADEIKRVGKRYFLQTPNRHFLIEPHFFFPLFQFLPRAMQIWLVAHFSLGSYPKIPDKQEAMKAIDGIRLLTKKELKILFPNATFFEEKFLGLTKSYIVYEGWW